MTSSGAKKPTNDDFQRELQKVLSDSNFSFTGNFYHASVLSNPPNPCLTVEGLGLVGLPLGERDAQAIIATCPSLPPPRQGKGARAKTAKNAKKEVQTAWEIEPSKISFGNTAWQSYVDGTLLSMLYKSLGLRTGASGSKLEFSKLLVYKTGAHILPDHETQKTDGVFGTAIILLPSAYTGGQAVVSHASNTKTIDFAKDSILSTALLAWYTDVKYELKPVESGYRVALAYNLVYVPQNGVPMPSLPDMTESTTKLRNVLEKWKNLNDNDSSPQFIAYLLKDRHDPFVLKIRGTDVLTGVDLHRATFIRPVAEAMGFRVYIASLEHKISGFAEAKYPKRRGRGRDRYHSYLDYLDLDSEDDLDGTPTMTEINSITTKITELKDMHGASILFGSGIDVKDNCLVPQNPFAGEEPDETENEGYVCSELVHCYRRTALVLMQDDKADDILYAAEGSFYAYKMLSKSTNIPPTPNDRKWAERLLKGGSSLKEADILLLLKFALKWQDLELWKSTTSSPSCSLSMVNSKNLANPMEVFTFEDMRLSFEPLLERCKSLPAKMDFLSKFSPKGSSNANDVINLWYQQEVVKILSSYSSAKAQDVPTLLSIIRLFGLKAFQNLVMPNLKEVKDFEFWIAFVQALWENRTTILENESSLVPPEFTSAPSEQQNPSSTPAAESTLHSMINNGLKAATFEWSCTGFKNLHYSNPYSSSVNDRLKTTRVVKLDRIIKVIDQAIVMSELGVCKTLFDDILESKHFNTFHKAKDIFCPLLPRLRELLAKKGLDIFQSPFVDFIRSFLGLYLRDVLGKKGELSSQHMYKIGCMGKCDDCKSLDNFIMDPKQRTTLIRAPKARRLHLERQADADGQDLFTYEVVTSTSPHGLQLTKLPAVIEASTWPSRQKAAKIVLDIIGSASDIERIMGTRVLDVKYAFDGLKPFDIAPALSAASTSAATTSTRTVTPVPQNSAQSQISRVTTVPGTRVTASNNITAVPRKASATGFPSQALSKKRKT